ncbi:hypothetical protein NDU88_001720 [Pleurodeles waltl]|uniref:Uncharacterized protein n=1 Tax=Pleurodeles waltl TaxID=8319 RepID=A0AAV7KR08_PLEWA|nr:hypothetical protein NDU88_001720 [Pleurodeles waltl]
MTPLDPVASLRRCRRSPCRVGGLFSPKFASRRTEAGWAPKWQRTAEAAFLGLRERRATVTARRRSAAELGAGAGGPRGRRRPPRLGGDGPFLPPSSSRRPPGLLGSGRAWGCGRPARG